MYGLRSYSASRCADETSPKPHPAMLIELMQELAVQRHELVMIGDTSHDLGMAQSAGVDAVAHAVANIANISAKIRNTVRLVI